MAEKKPFPKTLTRIAVIAFAVVTAVLLLPGYLTSWQAVPPVDAEFYVAQAFERHTRVFDEAGKFGRLPSDADYGAVTSFTCSRSSAARREFGWRGAREVLFDCPAAFTDAAGQTYAWVFRLIPDTDIAAGPSPEGYRTQHIDAEEAGAILRDLRLMPGP